MRVQALVFRSTVLAILLAGTALAQTPAPTVVRWQRGARNSDLVVRNGLEIVMLGRDGLTVKVTLTVLTVGHPRQVALVEVVNGTDQRVEVVPSRITLDLVEPELKLFPYLNPDTLAAELRRMAKKDLESGVTSDMNREFTEDKTGMASDTEHSALRENTLLPGESISGDVFFAAPERFEQDYGKGKLGIVLSVPVGDYVFKFPFGWETSPPTTTRVGDRVFDFPLWWKAKSG